MQWRCWRQVELLWRLSHCWWHWESSFRHCKTHVQLHVIGEASPRKNDKCKLQLWEEDHGQESPLRSGDVLATLIKWSWHTVCAKAHNSSPQKWHENVRTDRDSVKLLHVQTQPLNVKHTLSSWSVFILVKRLYETLHHSCTLSHSSASGLLCPYNSSIC